MFRSTCNLPGNHNALAVSAASGATTAQAIGQVQSIIGAATVTRAAGDVLSAKPGDAIYAGDVIETASDGAVGIVFSDGTAFNLSDNARMVLDEFDCDAQGRLNSALRCT